MNTAAPGSICARTLPTTGRNGSHMGWEPSLLYNTLLVFLVGCGYGRCEVTCPVLSGRVWPPPPLYTSFFILSLPFWYLVLLRQAEAGKCRLECWQPHPRDCEKETFLVELLIVTSSILSSLSSLSWRRSSLFMPSEGLGLPDRVMETALNGKPRIQS